QQTGGGTSCGEFAWKVDDAAPNGGYDTSTNQYGNTPVLNGPTITFSNSDSQTFDWVISAGYTVCAVIVKASTYALVYNSDPAASSDTGLYSPTNPNNGNLFDISHVSLVFSEADGGQCYEEETAWAEGDRYVNRGNWAMNVPYAGEEKTVDLIADFTNYVDAGDVTFSAPVAGVVTITINLTGGAIFYYDGASERADENLKIQDYDKAPNKTPKIGLFDHKWTFDVGTTTATVQVPQNNFYGIHVDLALVVDCSTP
ncbi:MAG: hypothetical protein NWR61_09160, partial [Pseudomonadales bacterium]|nr:hypothetical protein [Pseudomonadales bacterium]